MTQGNENNGIGVDSTDCFSSDMLDKVMNRNIKHQGYGSFSVNEEKLKSEIQEMMACVYREGMTRGAAHQMKVMSI